jgi:hypothetical protein
MAVVTMTIVAETATTTTTSAPPPPATTAPPPPEAELHRWRLDVGNANADGADAMAGDGGNRWGVGGGVVTATIASAILVLVQIPTWIQLWGNR